MEKEYKIKEIIDEVEKNSLEKLTLSNEINFTDNLKEYLKPYQEKLQLEKIKFPKIYAYLSSENMVVSEYIYGTYFYDLITSKSLSYKNAMLLVKAQLFFILKIGIFYNNLHSGNLMIDENENIYYLDCNIVSNISLNTRLQLLKLFKAICLRNFPYASVILNELSEISLTTLDLEKLSTIIKEIFTNEKLLYQEVFFIKIMKSFREASKLGMIFPQEIFPVFKSLIYLDSILFVSKNKNSKIKSDILSILNEIEMIITDNSN